MGDQERREEVLQGSTEPPGTGELLDEKREGTFRCAGCGEVLFSSEHKYDSGSGWPSFYEVAGDVKLREDQSHGMIRTEAICPKCQGHLGHVFDDGPRPTGTRYCINSAALRFDPEDPQR